MLRNVSHGRWRRRISKSSVSASSFIWWRWFLIIIRNRCSHVRICIRISISYCRWCLHRLLLIRILRLLHRRCKDISTDRLPWLYCPSSTPIKACKTYKEPNDERYANKYYYRDGWVCRWWTSIANVITRTTSLITYKQYNENLTYVVLLTLATPCCIIRIVLRTCNF